MLRGWEPRKFDPFLAAQKIRSKYTHHEWWATWYICICKWPGVVPRMHRLHPDKNAMILCRHQSWVKHENRNRPLSLTSAPISCGAVSRAFIGGGGHTHGFLVIFWPIRNLKAHSQNLSHPYPCCLLLVRMAGAPPPPREKIHSHLLQVRVHLISWSRAGVNSSWTILIPWLNLPSSDVRETLVFFSIWILVTAEVIELLLLRLSIAVYSTGEQIRFAEMEFRSYMKQNQMFSSAPFLKFIGKLPPHEVVSAGDKISRFRDCVRVILVGAACRIGAGYVDPTDTGSVVFYHLALETVTSRVRREIASGAVEPWLRLGPHGLLACASGPVAHDRDSCRTSSTKSIRAKSGTTAKFIGGTANVIDDDIRLPLRLGFLLGQVRFRESPPDRPELVLK